MKKSHRNLVIGIGGVLAVALIVRFAMENREVIPPAMEVEAPLAAETPPKPSLPQDENRPMVAPAPLAQSAVSETAAPGEAPIEHMLRGVIAANMDELRLSAEEVDRLVAETLEFHEIHTEIAARFMQESSFDPSTVTVRIPAFPVEGKAVRDLFHGRLKSGFTDGKFERIQEHLGHYIDYTFRGFGIADQTYTLTRSKEQPSAIELSWEAKVPEGQTHSGLNEGMSYPGGSGVFLLTPEQIMTGEYRFLTRVLTTRFPEISRKIE